MIRPSVLLPVVLSVCACATGGTSSLATKYRPANMFGGYSEKIVEPGIWRVNGRANGVAGEGFARNMAAYRAAEILQRQGFAFMQVINQKGSNSYLKMGSSSTFAGSTMSLWVRGARSASEPLECRAKMRDRCFTVPVAQIISRTRPKLTFPGDGS